MALKKGKCVAALLLGLFMPVSAYGCSGGSDSSTDDSQSTSDSTVEQITTGPAATADGVVEKQSDDRLKFVTPDRDFNEFINDYFEREVGVLGKQVNAHFPGGNGVVEVWKEWEALSLMWFDSTATGDLGRSDGYVSVRNQLRSIPQDKFGYIWATVDVDDTPDANNSYTNFDQGWPFPSFEHFGATNYGFGSNFNDASLPAGWSVSGAGASVGGGNLTLSPASGSKEMKLTLSDISQGYAFFAPFVETELKITGNGEKAIEDLYLEWTTKGGDSYSVSYAEAGTQAVDINDRSSYHYYFNTAVCEGWGKSNDVCCVGGADEGKEITSMSLVFKAKEGKSFDGMSVAVDFLRTDPDDRCIQTNAIYLSAFAEYYRYTGDDALLAELLGKCRKAFQFYLTYCDGADGLIDQDNFVGHDGLPISGHGISSGYFDILSLPSESFYFNVYYYKAIEAMAYLEKMAAAAGIADATAEVATPDLAATAVYAQTADTLTKLGLNCRTAIQTTFWSEEKGRFVEGYVDWEKSGHTITGTNVSADKTIDYGFLSFNLEGVAAGIATDEQAKKIMDWVSGERIVNGDTAKGKDDIYTFVCSPLITTRRNLYQYAYGGFSGSGTGAFGNQVQNGGSAMWVSYYDLKARASVYGADNVYRRTREICDWYADVSADYYDSFPDGASPARFFREYAANNMISLQGGNTSGALGLDEEFLENALVYAAYPQIILGLNSADYGVLEIAPDLPSVWGYFKMENLAYRYVKYDCCVSDTYVRISDVREASVGSYAGMAAGLKIRVSLKQPDGNFSVYINGEKTQDYTLSDGRITVEVPFGNCFVNVA